MNRTATFKTFDGTNASYTAWWEMPFNLNCPAVSGTSCSVNVFVSTRGMGTASSPGVTGINIGLVNGY